jgi:hypothetical protein
MTDILKVVRYCIFFVFVISNAVTTSVAVWNLSIVESSTLFVTAKQLDIYLITLGSTGLFLIFPIIFFEIYGRVVFLNRVWFELLWVGIFGLMELVGASFLTSQSTSQLCVDTQSDLTIDPALQESPCKSTQVLLGFTWTPAILLLGYLSLLLILSCVKNDRDRKVWFAGVKTYPWIESVKILDSAPNTPSKPMFRSKTPVIYAPKPQRTAAPILAYRGGIGSEYEIEHFKPSDNAEAGPSYLKPVPPVPVPTLDHFQFPRPLPQQPEQMPQPVFSTPFYHSSVNRVIDSQPGAPQPPPSAQLAQVRRLPPSPPPLGDWPRLDATSKPRTKRKPLPMPQAEPPPSGPPQPSLRQSGPYVRPLQINAVGPMGPSTIPSQSRRSRPSGPRIRRPSEDDATRSRPPPLDLSKISSHRSAGFK